MKRKKTTNSTKPIKDSSSPSFINKTRNAKAETEIPGNETGQTKQESEVAPHIVPCNDKNQRTMNTWNKWSIGFNGIMMLATVGVFLYTVYTFREVKKQFEIESRPFIILSNVKPDTLKPNTDLKLFCVIKNVGKTPALLITAKTGIELYKSENPPADSLKYAYQDRRGNYYLQSGDTMKFTFRGGLPDSRMYGWIMGALIFPLAYGEIIFKDIVSNKKYSYTFCIRILDNGRFVPTELNNRLIEVPNDYGSQTK